MHIHEISAKTGISLKKLRQLEKLGALKLSPVPELKKRADQLLFSMKRHKGLSVAECLAILDQPDILDELPALYSERAAAMIEALGPVAVEAAPLAVNAYLPDAARGDPDAVERIGEWVKATLPKSKPVAHAWIACRLLHGVPAAMRDKALRQVMPALMHVRRALPGWWTKEGQATVYHQFRSISLDL